MACPSSNSKSEGEGLLEEENESDHETDFQKFRKQTEGLTTEYLIERAQKIYETVRGFILTDEQCEQVVDIMYSGMKVGLSQESYLADIKPKHTFINELVNGHEEGNFLGLYLGLRKVKMALLSKPKQLDKEFEIQQCSYLMPDELFVGDGRKLFNFLVNCVDCFLTDLGIDKETFKFSLCFISPFPYEQTKLVEASIQFLLHYFTEVDGIIGLELNQLIRRDIKRQHLKLNIKCIFIINDTVGQLIAGARTFSNCKIALMIGLYTNAAYIENAGDVNMLSEAGFLEERPYLILDTQWASFGENGSLDFIRTEVDKELNLDSHDKEFRFFDKMVSGYYLGEIVRRILVKLIDQKLILRDKPTEDLLSPFSFTTEDIMFIECDKPGKYKRCRAVMKRHNIVLVSDLDCSAIRFVCEMVSTRSAHLTACALSVLIKKIYEEEKITISIDGFLYRKHPFFAHLMTNKMKKLLKDHYEYEILVTKFGPQVGGGLLAAAADRILCDLGIEEEECITEVPSSVEEEEEEQPLCDIEIKFP